LAALVPIGRHDFDLKNNVGFVIAGAVGSRNLQVRGLSARVPIFSVTK